MRPQPRVRLPARLLSLAVINTGNSRDDELAHLRRLPGCEGLTPDDLKGQFLRAKWGACSLRWERHSEFTRLVSIEPLGEGTHDEAMPEDLSASRAAVRAWLRDTPGKTIAAVELLMVPGDLSVPEQALAQARRWLPEGLIVASQMGGGHSCVATDFAWREDGSERLVVVAPPDTTVSRAGRVSQRLLELETYRLMALRGLPVAKSLQPLLAKAERELADIIVQLEADTAADAELLARLTALAASVERATAEHGYRFAATLAYDAIVRQRIAELREKPIPGTQTVGEFMQRRLAPAIATVDATAQRLASLSQRVERAGSWLRTRVDITAEAQNQQLLAKLTRGQELQLELQSTVEGLSIAAISYYVVSLLLYGAKAAKAAGVPIHPEVAAGAAIPLVLWAVWRMVRHIHHKLQGPH